MTRSYVDIVGAVSAVAALPRQITSSSHGCHTTVKNDLILCVECEQRARGEDGDKEGLEDRFMGLEVFVSALENAPLAKSSDRPQ